MGNVFVTLTALMMELVYAFAIKVTQNLFLEFVWNAGRTLRLIKSNSHSLKVHIAV